MKYTKLFVTGLFFIPILMVLSCQPQDPDNVIVLPPSPVDSTRTLKAVATYPIGAALNISKMKTSDAYTTLVKNEFSTITAENAMKPEAISPGRDRYNWTDADFFVDFAQENGLRIHGHCLVWHRAVPAWITNFNGTEEDWMLILQNYITAVVGRYKGRVASWDVVNEALLDNGTVREESIWYKKLGWKYVELAFRYAHEADPDAVLFYNDYGQEYSAVKLAAINDTVMSLVRRGVPVHGIGLQMHTNINQTSDRLITAINETKNTGLKVHVSELDVAINPNTVTGYVASDNDLRLQRIRYRSVTAAMRLVPDEQNWGVTTWGVSDADSWLRNNPDFPLLFDSNLQKKDCYFGVHEAFDAEL